MTSNPANVQDIVEALREACVDWNGAPMPDAEEPRRLFLSGELRQAADEIERLRAALADKSDVREALEAVNEVVRAMRVGRYVPPSEYESYSVKITSAIRALSQESADEG